MKQQFSRTLRRTSNDGGYEFGEEAKLHEPPSLATNFLVKHALQAEYARICRNPIEGIYIVPSETNNYRWNVVVFIRSGIFAGGIFRFTLLIQKDFPNTSFLPQIKFDISLFHPHIYAESKLLDLSKYFPDGWKKEKHHIQYALIVAQRIFFSLDADYDECANPEAAILWRNDRMKFKERAKEAVNQSRATIYDDCINDKSDVIKFTPWDFSIHEQVRLKMKNACPSNSSPRKGLSWLDVDRLTCMVEPLQHIKNSQTTEIIAGSSIPIERLDLSGMSDASVPNSSQLGTFDSSRTSNVSEEIEISNV